MVIYCFVCVVGVDASLLKDYPVIQKYMETMSKRPAYVEAYKVPDWYVPGTMP